MSVPDWQFAAFRLHLESPLHVGSWRAGMVAQTHRFVPGHIFSYALASAYGRALGADAVHFQTALQDVRATIRFAPAFITLDGKSPLFPHRDGRTIERHFVRGNNHASLQLDSCSAQDSALFEVEFIAARHRAENGGTRRTVLLGGCWFNAEHLGGRTWRDWLGDLTLGGEGKMGYGRCAVLAWDGQADSFHGVGNISGCGLSLAAGTILPGPALSGVFERPMQPWLGRLYDPEQGFGRKLGKAAFVCLDGVCAQAAVFSPYQGEQGLGCWAAI